MRRRRYRVVLEGVSGAAVAQRSVISEHRSESDARESAAHERRRLQLIHGEGASAWVVLVVRDGDVIAEERPEVLEPRVPPPARSARDARAAPPPTLPTPAPEPARARTEEAASEPEEPGEAEPMAERESPPEPEPAAEPRAAPEPEPEPSGPSEPAAEPRAAPEPESEPSGPVPEWVIRRFEDSIARRGAREPRPPAGSEAPDEREGRRP